MSLWTAIVVIVGMALLAQVIRSRHNAAVGYATDAEGDPVMGGDNRRERQLEAEIEELKERIKVLERIAYDDRKRLGLVDEIESLRD